VFVYMYVCTYIHIYIYTYIYMCVCLRELLFTNFDIPHYKSFNFLLMLALFFIWTFSFSNNLNLRFYLSYKDKFIHYTLGLHVQSGSCH
jgi:hypothetical protein